MESSFVFRLGNVLPASSADHDLGQHHCARQYPHTLNFIVTGTQ